MFRYINIYLTISSLRMAIKSSLLTNDCIDLHRLEKLVFFVREYTPRGASWEMFSCTLRQTNVRFATNFNFLGFCRPKTRQTPLNIYFKANTSQIVSLLQR